MKRMLALFLCLMMCFALLPAAAAEEIAIVRSDEPDEADIIPLVEPEEAAAAEPGAELMASKPVITSQPTSKTAYVDTTAKFTVMADGATSYQWQYRKSSSGSWNNSGLSSAKTATMSVKATSSLSGYQYRCAVKNAAGTTYSNTVTLTISKKPVITTQPKSVTMAEGVTAKFTVKADGATSYQWQYRKTTDGSWTNSGMSSSKTATLSIPATSARNGFQFRCAVKNASGTTYSNTVTLTVSKKPVITSQPKSVTMAEGVTAKFTVKADGATSYQWQYRKNSSGSWTDSGMSSSKTATLSIPATSARNGFQFRCAVKNASGTTYSSVVTLTVLLKPTISTQPLSCTASTGATVKFAVKASGAESYQWQYRKSEDGTWYISEMSSSKTATLSMPVTSARDGFQFRCKVTNAAGSVFSKTVTLNAISEQCGDKLSWTLDSAGKLTITGTGKMYDYDWENLPPWVDGIQPIKSVVIGNSVTRIGDCAFESHEKLTSVTIGTGVTAIGSYAFESCLALTSVKIPASVTTLGDTPFDRCTSLQSITVDSGNTKFSSADGVLFNKDKTVLLAYPAGKPGSYTVPSTVKTLADSAFSGAEKLSAVVLPEGLTTIEACALSSCALLTDIQIPASVTSIHAYAFDDSFALTAITVASGNKNYSSKNGVLYNKAQTSLLRFPSGKSGSFTVPSTVKIIENSAFFSCSKLSAVTIPQGVSTIAAYAFYGCSGLTSVTIPNSVQSIGEVAFCYCDHLKKVTIGTGVSAIESEAFAECELLTDVYYKGSQTQWKQITIGDGNDPLLKATFHYNA